MSVSNTAKFVGLLAGLSLSANVYARNDRDTRNVYEFDGGSVRIAMPCSEPRIFADPDGEGKVVVCREYVSSYEFGLVIEDTSSRDASSATPFDRILERLQSLSYTNVREGRISGYRAFAAQQDHIDGGGVAKVIELAPGKIAYALVAREQLSLPSTDDQAKAVAFVNSLEIVE